VASYKETMQMRLMPQYPTTNISSRWIRTEMLHITQALAVYTLSNQDLEIKVYHLRHQIDRLAMGPNRISATVAKALIMLNQLILALI
jgi:hypothetical protein